MRKLSQGGTRALAKAAALIGGVTITVALLATGAIPAFAQGARPAPAAAAAPAAVDAPGNVQHERLSLKQLRITEPVRLQGTRGEIGIPFGMRQDRVVTAASVTVRMAWSPALLDGLSQLVVLVNGEVAQTIPLNKANSGGQTLTIPVDPALFLPGDNRSTSAWSDIIPAIVRTRSIPRCGQIFPIRARTLI